MAQNELVKVDPAVFGAYFDRRPFYVESQLVGHPLFELSRIAQYARDLPERFVEYNAGNLPVGADKLKTPQNGLTPEETVRRIETCGSWLVLKRVEQIPEYQRLLDDCLSCLEPHVKAAGVEMQNRQAFLFVSSPSSVTPLHMDPEHNFLLQLQGTKIVHMWDPEDRYVVREEDLEVFHTRFTNRNLPYREASAATAYTLPLKPGQGLHFPVTAPHWVQNGPSVSVSFSITFRSDSSEKRRQLYRVNDRLRRLGLNPRPVGQNNWVDVAKGWVARSVDQVRAWRRQAERVAL